MGAYKALCAPSLGAPSHMTKTLQVENRQKMDKFEHVGPISG